ncbi:MAG: ferredoxin [Paracoccaceae bacterium]
MTAALRAALAPERLFVSGVVAETSETIFLISPDEPGFWPHVSQSPEFTDGAPDPLDRWSARVIGAMAADLGGQALFPFGGPPFTPFHHLALRSGQAFAAPIRFLVHARMGLWASYRGAIALPGTHGLPPPAANPCTDCAAPCLRSCPVAALSREGYDTTACHAHLDRDGENCLSSGCLARRACPAGKSYGRLPEQSSWHMRQFHP